MSFKGGESGISALILASAFLLDMVLGDPAFSFHPVRLLGHIIVYIEDALKRRGWNGKGGGMLLFLSVSGISVGIVAGLLYISKTVHNILYFFVSALFCYFAIALKDLKNHIYAVYFGLEKRDITLAKKELSKIVGRDVQSLNCHGIVRATIESMAENFVDGFLSPIFWYLLGVGLGKCLGIDPALIGIGTMWFYKAVNTLDSMVGYRDERYRNFGSISARADDIMNFIPSRICVLPFFIAGLIKGLDVWSGIKTFLRDRLKHESPNSAHAESLMAGTLNVRLGGPTLYPDGCRDREWLGEEFRDPEAIDIKRGMSMIMISGWITVCISIAVDLTIIR